MPNKLFMFGSMVLCVDSVGHLVPVKNYVSYQVITFESFEYTADSCGELILSGWAPGRIEDSSAIMGSTPESISALDL